MESKCDNRSARNTRLHIHTNEWSVRCGYDDECYGYQRNNSNVYPNSGYLPGFNSACIANDINQWHQRNMESKRDKCSAGNAHLHIHTNEWSVRSGYDDERNSYQQHDSNVYTNCCYLPGFYYTGVANNINQWHQRNMESKCYKHDTGNAYLYLHTNKWSVCCGYNYERYG